VKTIAIIPARGGSKRIPRKNVIDFCGRPLIAWTIAAARESGLFDRVLVSTEDPEIASVAREWGADCPFLRDSHYDDHSGASEATIQALQQTREYFGEDYELTVQLMATCPLRGVGEIKAALAAFRQYRRTFQVSCFAYGWMNPWWALQLDAQGQGERLFPRHRGKRSQDLPPLYCPTGAVWLARTEALMASGSFYSEPLCYEPMHWTRAVDIDTPEDLLMARCLYAMLQSPETTHEPL